jgi:hypothetical protein
MKALGERGRHSRLGLEIDRGALEISLRSRSMHLSRRRHVAKFPGVPAGHC